MGYSFCDESDQDILGSVHCGAHLPDRTFIQLRIQNQLDTTEAPQLTNDTYAVINANHSKEENDWNIELAPDSSHSKLPSPDVDDVAENRDVRLTATKGTEWHQITTSDYSAGRLSQKTF